MLGHNFWHIGDYLFKKYINIFLSSLAIGFLGLVLYLYFYNQFQKFFPFLYFWKNNIIPLIAVFFFIFIVAWSVTMCINISQMIKKKAY
ncbi:hypothetical protein P4V34_30350 [Bacillus thuringiensis]|nr:hypothetical protein [Bacillus thuringiensis]